MNSPSFSCICLTAGRVPLLEEALSCFIRQDYLGESELIVLNTCPQQQLELGSGCDNIRIINLRGRPKSLGDARNAAISFADFDWVVVWDDDDLYLPNHLSNFAKHTEGNEWVWQNKQFYMLSRQIKSIVPGTPNVVAFTKEAWAKVGGYKAMNCGEDRQFIGRLTTSCRGKKVELEDKETSFIYAWGNGAYHQSGMGDDVPGRPSSWRRAEDDLNAKIKRGQIPTGYITLRPMLAHDYEAMAAEFLKRNAPGQPKQGSVAVVELGRYGDIINILPILKHMAENYDKPTLVVARQFAQLLEGVSYVTPRVLDLEFTKLTKAIQEVSRQYDHVIVSQVWGEGWKQQRLTEAYNKESWRQAGFLHKWDDPTWLPVFDRRNKAREDALVSKLDVPGRPMLLYKLTGGFSSPCPDCHKLKGPLLERFGKDFNVINLEDVKAERIFDLLGLFDRAAALLTVDTSILHLASASPVPFVALVNPLPWLGTLPRGRCVRRMTYLEAVEKPGEVVLAMEAAIMR